MADTGSKALELRGSAGGCWEALANAPAQLPATGVTRISGAVRPTTNGSFGCHDAYRARLAAATDAGTWEAGKHTLLLSFDADGTVSAPGIDDLGSYRVDAWNRFRIRYEPRGGRVRITVSIDGEPRGSGETDLPSFAGDLRWLELASGDFTMQWDSLAVAHRRA